MIVKINGEADLNEFGLTFANILQMRDAGLIVNGDSIIQKYKNIKNNNLSLNFRKKILFLKSDMDKYNLPVYILSSAGQELYRIQNCEVNNDYLNKIEIFLKSNGFYDLKDKIEKK